MTTAQRSATYFISDIHLGSRCVADPRAHEQAVVRWLDSIAADAEALYILGDALDYWYEYRDVVPRGFVRFFGALARLADAGVRITWIKGNHDIWIFDYLPNEIGMTVVDGTVDTIIGGRRFVMEHGDRSGETRPSYRRMQRIFRNPTCQRLFAAIHPRWTVEFAHRWSAHSRRNGTEAQPITLADPLVDYARNYISRHGHVDYFLFGHRHVASTLTLPEGAEIMIIGDAFRLMTYARFDRSGLKLCHI